MAQILNLMAAIKSRVRARAAVEMRRQQHERQRDSLRSLKIILRDKIGESIYIHQPRLIASQKSGLEKAAAFRTARAHTEAFNSLETQK
jgi:hypothetical protein